MPRGWYGTSSSAWRHGNESESRLQLSAPERDCACRPVFLPVSSNGTTICLLDDNASVLKATSRMLFYAGYAVQSFTDPMSSLAYAGDHRPRAVVLDILMPAMNGLEVQRRLRRVSPSTRVIILSSKDDPIVRVTATREGASAFFIKGVENKEFLTAIESALNGNVHEAGGNSEQVVSVTGIQSAAAES